MKFTKDTTNNRTGRYVSGRWSIVNTARQYWELRLDGTKVMGYTSLAAAKAGAEEYEAQRASEVEVTTYELRAANGRAIRRATAVTINGQRVEFLDRMPKGQAIRQAHAELERQAAR